MDNMVAYVFDRSSDSQEPVMIFLMRDGKVTAHAPKASSRSRIADSITKNLSGLDEEDAQESFDDLIDRYDGVASLTQAAKYVGAEARRAETFLRKWSRGGED